MSERVKTLREIPRPQDKRANLQDSGGLREVPALAGNALSHNWQASESRTLHACDACGIVKEFTSPEFWGKCWGKPDHKPDGSGLDDGPYLPGKAPRKKSPAKSADKLAETRGKAWETRRHLYGQKGHK